MNKLEIKPNLFGVERIIDDIFIDGKSIQEISKMGISPFGWLRPEGEIHFVESFLLKLESDLGDQRYPILVCTECADLSCGALTAKIIKTKHTYIWKEFGYQNDYENGIDFSPYRKIGPFEFQIKEYESLFNWIIETNKKKL